MKEGAPSSIVIPGLTPGSLPPPARRVMTARDPRCTMDPGSEAGVTEGAEASAVADVPRVRALLLDAARAGEDISYSRLLLALGIRFTRPKMRALCRTLDAIDREGAAAGEPGLAVLVVRESDRLPGQGWWTGHTKATGYAGGWEGAAAAREVLRWQRKAFAHWRAR